jgi:hypothetical protein
VLIVATAAIHRPTDLTLVGHMLIVVHFCHSRYVKHHDPPLTILIIEGCVSDFCAEGFGTEKAGRFTVFLPTWASKPVKLGWF